MIIIHNTNEEAFTDLLGTVVDQLQIEAKRSTTYFLQRNGVSLEKDVFVVLSECAAGTIFENKVELISGQRFPDIVAYVNQSEAYGIEVKTTKNRKWTSIGGSIFEGKRVTNVESIFLLFAQLVDPIRFKCRRYEECLYNVAITHSPRYLIDMDLPVGESIFSKIGVEYNELRKLEKPFKPIRHYLRKNLAAGNDLWWVDEEELTQNIEVTSWKNLSVGARNELRASGLAYFPNLFSSHPSKYHMFGTYLISRYGVVCSSIRDIFSAKGQVTIHDSQCPRIFGYAQDHLRLIKTHLDKAEGEDLLHYWGKDDTNIDWLENRFLQWKKLCLDHAARNSRISAQQQKVLEKILCL